MVKERGRIAGYWRLRPTCRLALPTGNDLHRDLEIKIRARSLPESLIFGASQYPKAVARFNVVRTPWIDRASGEHYTHGSTRRGHHPGSAATDDSRDRRTRGAFRDRSVDQLCCCVSRSARTGHSW